MSEKKVKISKIINIVMNVILYVFLAVAMFLLIISISSKKDSDGAADIFGHQLRIVISESMEKHEATYDEIKQYKIKNLPLKTMVFIKKAPDSPEKALEWYGKIKVGDVLTFRYVMVNKQETITHRVKTINPKINAEGQVYGYIIELQGDNRGTNTHAGIQVIDTSIEESPNYVVGKVIGKSFIIGLFVTALKQPIGIFLIVIVPSLIIMILEIIKIINYFATEKKKKSEEEVNKQKDEIEELKRQIAALSNSQQNIEPQEVEEQPEEDVQD